MSVGAFSKKLSPATWRLSYLSPLPRLTYRAANKWYVLFYNITVHFAYLF